ncbi:MAG: DUF2911 domain-containing protein [Bacteroidota bacterium]
MKRLFLSTCLLISITFLSFGQGRPSPPAEVTASVNRADVTINYSQPAVKGRTIWGDLVPYDAVWRTGANEATWIEVSKDVTIEGQKLEAGKYGLFTIPGKDEWTIIFNDTWQQWGAYEYDKSKDALRVTVKPESVSDSAERMTFSIADDGVVDLRWDKLKVSFNVD